MNAPDDTATPPYDTTPRTPAPDRAIRQRDLVPPARLAACDGLVVGVGAIGRQVAWQLAAMGIPQLILVDPDTVAIENLAVQAYDFADLGMPKVDACAAACQRLNPDLRIEPIRQAFARSSPHNCPSLQLSEDRQLIVFCCVDSMSARRTVFEGLRHRASFFADGRMAGEVLRVLVCPEPATDEHYPTALCPDGQAHAAPCTGRSTLYSASIAAGLMLAGFAAWLRRTPVCPDLIFNLPAGELTVSSA